MHLYKVKRFLTCTIFSFKTQQKKFKIVKIEKSNYNELNQQRSTLTYTMVWSMYYGMIHLQGACHSLNTSWLCMKSILASKSVVCTIILIIIATNFMTSQHSYFFSPLYIYATLTLCICNSISLLLQLKLLILIINVNKDLSKNFINWWKHST
jgi:hypothetical protein